MADDDVSVKLSLKGRKQFSSEADRAAKDIDKVSKAAKGANRSTREASAGVKSLGSQFSGIASIGRKVAGVGLAMGTAAGAAGIFGLRTVSSLEQADIAFTTMLGSAEKSKAFLDELKTFAAKTPFEFPELQSAASSLISVGIDAKKVIPIMNSLGNATSGMGTGQEGIKRATIALQQMNAAGRITGEDLNQLRDAGIPVFDLLAAATGKSKEAVAELAQTGKLGKKELEQLMSALESGKGLERFSGLMDKQSRSLGGLFSTLKDAATMGLATALLPVGDQLRDVMPSAITATTRGAELLGNKIGLLAGKLKEMRDNGTLSRMWEKAKEVTGDLATIWSQSLWPAIKDLSHALGGKEGLLAPLGAVLGVLSWMADHPTAGQVIFELMAVAITSWKLAQLIQGVALAVDALKLSLAAPTGLLGAVIALPLALGLLYDKLDLAGGFLTGFGAALGPQLGTLFTMRDVLTTIADKLGLIDKKKNVVQGVNVGPWASGLAPQNSQQGGGAIGAMATGGIVSSAGVSLVGERGPELLTLPRGSRVDPLPNDSGLELGPSIVIHPGAISVATSDPRLAARLVVEEIQNMAARK